MKRYDISYTQAVSYEYYSHMFISFPQALFVKNAYLYLKMNMSIVPLNDTVLVTNLSVCTISEHFNLGYNTSVESNMRTFLIFHLLALLNS